MSTISLHKVMGDGLLQAQRSDVSGNLPNFRAQKKIQIKNQRRQTEVKNTKTKRIYDECLKEVDQNNKKIIEENKRLMPQEEDDSIKPIRNIFKMNRVQVESQQNMKKNHIHPKKKKQSHKNQNLMT